jgi:hypothetical protein
LADADRAASSSCGSSGSTGAAFRRAGALAFGLAVFFFAAGFASFFAAFF